jgi:hypothetical protein
LLLEMILEFQILQKAKKCDAHLPRMKLRRAQLWDFAKKVSVFRQDEMVG